MTIINSRSCLNLCSPLSHIKVYSHSCYCVSVELFLNWVNLYYLMQAHYNNICLNYLIIPQTIIVCPGSILLLIKCSNLSLGTSFFVNLFCTVVCSRPFFGSLVTHIRNLYSCSGPYRWFAPCLPICCTSTIVLVILIYLTLTFCYNIYDISPAVFFSINVLVLGWLMFFHLQLTYWFPAHCVFLYLGWSEDCDCARTVRAVGRLPASFHCEYFVPVSWTPLLP